VTLLRWSAGAVRLAGAKEPVETDVQAWFDRLDAYRKEPFMPEGRWGTSRIRR
jgi:hypothetical protein